MDDNALLAMINDGNHIAFNNLVDKYVVPLNIFAGRIIGDSTAAKDIVQDTFVHVWEHRKELKSVSHIRNYLYLVTRNYALNYVKRLSKRSIYGKNMGLIEEDISAQYIRTETARLLREAIDKLPHRTAEVLRLTMDGLKQEEIAARMHITLATTKAHKGKGIKKLREILGPLSYLVMYIPI